MQATLYMIILYGCSRGDRKSERDAAAQGIKGKQTARGQTDFKFLWAETFDLL